MVFEDVAFEASERVKAVEGAIGCLAPNAAALAAGSSLIVDGVRPQT